MVKKWAEVESSEAYQKLPETEKTTAKEQYFSQVVAPKVPEADVGIAREQFFNYVSGSAPKAPTTFQGKVEPQPAAKPTQDFTTYDPMGSDLGSSIMDVAGPERSVMNGVTGPTGAPVKQTPVKPEVLAAFEARYDAATPKQRKVMEAQPNWMGDIARQRAQESARMDVAQTKAPSLTKVDPRVEARRLELIGQGEKPEFAEVAAQDAAEAGVPVGQEMAYARSKGVLEPTKFDFEMLKQYQNAPAIVRGAVQGYEGFKQGALGVNQALAELVGADDFARTQAMGAEESRGKTQSMGENANYLGRMFEGAISSIAQQLPSMVGGALTGSEALVLGSMFVNTFGQEYSDSRAKGQDGAEAASRAGLFGAFEVIGERFGMKFELDNIRRAASGMKTDQLKDFLANTLKKELPGEYLTTTGQFLVDKSAIGLNKDATLKDYLQQMADTTVQTLMQGGTMTAGTKAIEYAASKLPTAETEPSAPSIPSAEQLMRERGFLQGKSTKKEMPLETEGEEKAIRTAGAPETRVEPTIAELTPEEKAGLRQKKVEELATQIIERQGLPAEDAMRIAEGKLRAQEELDIKRQDRKQEEVENRETLIKPSETRVEELTDGFIGIGMHPTEAAHRATLIAQEEAENDKLAETEAKGGKNAGKPITATGGAGTGVSSERAATVPSGGTTTPVTTGLGDTGADARESEVGDEVQPSALDKARQNLEAAKQDLAEAEKRGNPWEIAGAQGVRAHAQSQVEKAYYEQQEGTNVAQTTKAEQTEEEKQEAPAAGAPKKRGRPALPLELKTASEQKRVRQRAAYKATEKQLNKAEQMFADANAPIDEGAVESEEQLREMVDNKRRDRNAAIRTLYDISKANRGKPGQRAAELLKHPSITQRELVEAAQGHELRKKAAVANISGMSKAVEAAAADTVADDKLGKVTNGAQAITHIIKTGNEFQKILARRIRSTVSGVKIVVVEKNQPTPAIFLKNPRYEREWNRARAVYVEGDFTKEKVVYVRGASFGEDQGVNNITILHELLHAATNRKIQLAQQAIVNGEYKDTALINAQMQLVEVMNNASSRFDELVFTGKLPEHIMKLKEYGDIFSDPREFLAYGMTDPAMQDFLKTAYGQPSPVGYFNQFVDSIRNFFGMDVSDSNALADLINATDSILSARPVGKLEPLGLQISLATLGDLLGLRKKDETPAFAGESTTVAPSADVERMATMLGAKLYGTPENIAQVSVKELFQNSFDAIKGSLENGQLKEGKINIKLDDKNRIVTITDNGLGMPASVMGKQFLQIAGTVKETKRASGGFGIAKMLFLFENKQLEVVSLRDGELARMVTTGADLKAALKDPSRGPQLVTTRDPNAIAKYKDMFPEGHGTTVSVTIPEDFVDASTGETKKIPFSGYQIAGSDVLNHSPLFDNVEVTLDRGNGPVKLDIGTNFPIDKYTPFANVNFAWGTARVYISKKPEQSMYGQNTHVLSNGLWQFDTNIKDRPGFNGKTINRHFYIDVTPKESVKPEDPGYPFDMNRQRFSTTVNEDFGKIFNYISAIYSQIDLADSSKTFGLVQYVNANGTLTEAKQLEPKTPMTDNAFTMIKPGDQVEVRDGVLYVNNRALPELTAKDLEKTSIRLDELTIPQNEIDPTKVMVHDNTVVKNDPNKKGMTIEEVQAQLPEGWRSVYRPGHSYPYWVYPPGFDAISGETIPDLVKKLSNEGIQIQVPLEYAPRSLSEVAREKFGERFDKYLVEIGDTFKAIRAALITSSNGEYADLAKEAIGVSIDMEYYGVSIIVPFRGMFINPAVTSLYANAKQTAVSMIGTMLHELAHFKVRNHNADFASEMQRVINLVETHDSFDLQAAKARLTKHIEANQDIFDYLNKEFRDGNLTAGGNRFKDAGYQQIGDGSSVGSVEGARASGEQLESGVSGGVGPSYQNIGKVGIGAGANSQTSQAGSGDELRTQKEINKEVDIDLEKIRISRQAEKLAREVGILQTLRDPRKIIPAMRRLWKGATYAQRVALVKPVTTEFLAAWGGTYIPELKNTNVLLEKMSGMTQQLLHSAAILAQTVHKAFKEDTTLQSKLEEVAYASTLAEIDPSDPNAEERSPKLDKLYAQLGFKGQQLFTLIKEHYENLSDYFGQLLDDQIINSRISDDAKNTLMAKIRQMYEAEKKITPYFPLVRRGDYWLAVDSGKHRKFFTFETMAERDAAAEGFAKERRTSLDELKEGGVFVLGNDIGSLRTASFDSSDLLKGLFEIIDRENFGNLSAEDASAAKDALKDAVYQLYLTTMPEQSFRRQFISRKNITGFSTDLLRNLSTTGVKMSTQLARIKYSPLLRNSLSAARDSIAGREELEPFIKEMEKRVSETLNPGKDGAFGVVANVLNRAAFLHYLSGASSALLQPLGVFQTGTPILMSRYGVVGATVELTRMLKVWDQYGITRTNPDGSQSFVPPSIANATGFTPDEKRAVREMLAHDVSQSTYASALFGYKSAATINYGSVAERGKRAAATLTGGLLHSTERLSREMLFMASYRLNIKNKATHQQAVNNAVRDTNEALGNYGAYNRPPMMKKGLGKVMLQFTMYPVHTTLFLLRNFKKSLPLLNKEGKWEATKIFYGTLGTTYILAGAVGLPMFSMIMGLLGWAWRDEDKPQELQDMDYETWWRTVWLPEKMGHITIGGRPLSAIIERGPVNGLTGLDISSRTSLNDLWLRDTKETKTAREGALALAVEKAGPSANMILSYADAYEAFTNGDYQKGVEKISPALVRNFVMTHKYATEGAKDNKGAEIMAQGTFTSGELLGQAIGFRSDLLANTQQVAFKMNAINQRVDNERTKTLNNLAREYLVGENTGKWDGYLKQLDKREKFNTRYPEKAITDDQLIDSLDKRQKQRGEAWAGVTVDEKSMPYAGEAMLNITDEIARREKEMGKRK